MILTEDLEIDGVVAFVPIEDQYAICPPEVRSSALALAN